jgi:aspartate 1-decarboxylase
MNRKMLKSKIHRARVTDSNLSYTGSITIDENLLEAANILEYENVYIVNVNTGARFETYTITGKRGSGEICLNGAAARLVQVEDVVIIMTFADYNEQELGDYKPVVVCVDKENRIVQPKI